MARACQYIQHLKENEARNIEKWTLEKLLMDQAMGDLQAQLEEVRRAWEEERVRRGAVEERVRELEGLVPGAGAEGNTGAGARKRAGAGSDAADSAGEASLVAAVEASNKRQRLE